jgi:hypothetical protein
VTGGGSLREAAGMDAELTLLLERQAVVDTVIRYATGIDMRDWEAYRSCFTDTCHYDFSSWSGRPGGPMRADDWVSAVRGTNGNFDCTQHISTNHVVTFGDGDPASGRATCVSYMHAQHFFTPDTMASFGRAGAVNFCTLGGYYTNQLVRGEDGWRIADCRLQVTWQTGDTAIFDLARNRTR